jgi:hypothetical protein
MALSDIQLGVTDNALGIVPETIDGISAKIGISSLGAPNTVYSFGDGPTLKSTLGVGPLVEAAAHLLAISGGPVYCVPATIVTPGAAGAVTHAGTGPAMTVAGAALDAYQAVITIVAGGVLGTGTFKYTMDGGDTSSSTIVIPSGGSFTIPDSNLTLSFPAGTYVASDTYSFSTTAPMYDASALATALTALLADPREWRFLHVVGLPATVAASAGLAAAVDIALASAVTSYRYVRAFLECPEDTDPNIIAAFSSTTSTRVGIAVGMEELSSSISGRIYKRPAAWPVAARAAKARVHEDLGRYASGALPGVSKLYRDERVMPGLDSQRFTTLRTFTGAPGYYITAGRTLAGPSSDYQLIQNGFVIDKACRIARSALLRYLNDSIRVDSVTGFIYELDAKAIESDVESQLRTGIISPGNASAVVVKVIRNNNILSSQTLALTIRVIPMGYARFISVDIGLYNPSLTPA